MYSCGRDLLALRKTIRKSQKNTHKVPPPPPVGKPRNARAGKRIRVVPPPPPVVQDLVTSTSTISSSNAIEPISPRLKPLRRNPQALNLRNAIRKGMQLKKCK